MTRASKIKAARKARLLSLLNCELERVHHNATLHCPPLPEMSKYSKAEQERIKDYIYSDLNDLIEWEIEELNEGDIAREYGSVYCYGRGGATCAPEGWMGGFERAWPKSAEGGILSFGKIVPFIRIVADWNEAIRDFCSENHLSFICADAFAQVAGEIDAGRAELASMLII